MLRFFSRRRLLCFAAVTVLVLLVEYRYTRLSVTTAISIHVSDLGDNQRVEVSSSRNVRCEQWTRYVIAIDYWEQLTMATNNLFTLLWFCKQWNASVIVPYVKDSHFYGLWKRWNSETALPLDLLYDRSQLNSLLEGYRLPPLVTMETFLTKAKRSLIVLQFFYNGDKLGRRKADLMLRFNEAYVYDCTIYMKNSLDTFVKILNERATSSFSVKACYCVNASHEIYPDKLAEIIGIQGDSDASVIFKNWRGISESGPITTANGYQKKGRLFVPGLEKAAIPNGGTVALPYSSYVRRNASNFIRSLNIEAEFVVVHLRSERLGERDERINGYFAQCWAEVSKILQEDILSEHPNITVLYFTDYGLLGSSSCLRKNCSGARIANAMLAKNGLKATRFDPAKFNAVSDSGFVALVEQCVMAMSRYLLLVGGGSFQTQIRQQFLSQPTAERGFTVCSADNIGWNSFNNH